MNNFVVFVVIFVIFFVCVFPLKRYTLKIELTVRPINHAGIDQVLPLKCHKWACMHCMNNNISQWLEKEDTSRLQPHPPERPPGGDSSVATTGGRNIQRGTM